MAKREPHIDALGRLSARAKKQSHDGARLESVTPKTKQAGSGRASKKHLSRLQERASKSDQNFQVPTITTSRRSRSGDSVISPEICLSQTSRHGSHVVQQESRTGATASQRKKQKRKRRRRQQESLTRSESLPSRINVAAIQLPTAHTTSTASLAHTPRIADPSWVKSDLDCLRAFTRTTLPCVPAKTWTSDDMPTPREPQPAAISPLPKEKITGSTIELTIASPAGEAHNDQVTAAEDGDAIKIYEQNEKIDDGHDSNGHCSPSALQRHARAAVVPPPARQTISVFSQLQHRSVPRVVSGYTPMALTVPYYRSSGDIVSAFESFSHFIDGESDTSGGISSDSPDEDFGEEERLATTKDLALSNAPLLMYRKLDERTDTFSQSCLEALPDHMTSEEIPGPDADEGSSTLNQKCNIGPDSIYHKPSESSSRFSKSSRIGNDAPSHSVGLQSSSQSSTAVRQRTEPAKPQYAQLIKTQGGNDAASNTDTEEDRVEEKLFKDIETVWEEITSLTRSTSLGKQDADIPSLQPPSVMKTAIRQSSAGYYDLPNYPLSPLLVVCQQTVTEEHPTVLLRPDSTTSANVADGMTTSPPVRQKRKRATSNRVSPDKRLRPGSAAVQKQDTTPMDAHTNNEAPIHMHTRQSTTMSDGDGPEDSDASQMTPRAIAKKPRAPAGVSMALFPPTSAAKFGLLQEKVWQEPFWLLIAVTFLNKTAGRAAAPVFWELKKRYPTPDELANAKLDDLRNMIRHLGLQTQRATRLLKIARAWVDSPPKRGCLYRTLHYPQRNEGKEYDLEEIIDKDIPTCAGALEIGHIPGCGPYAWDSWRIFCRDVLRGVADDYNGLNARPNFKPEWQRVLPSDKELRACLRWMWLREGYIWDHETGKKRKVNHLEREKAMKGEMGPTDGDEIKFTAQAQQEECEVLPLSVVKIPRRRSLRLSGNGAT